MTSAALNQRLKLAIEARAIKGTYRARLLSRVDACSSALHGNGLRMLRTLNVDDRAETNCLGSVAKFIDEILHKPVTTSRCGT